MATDALTEVLHGLGARSGWVLVVGDASVEQRAAIEAAGLRAVLVGTPTGKDPAPLIARAEHAEPPGRPAAVLFCDVAGWPMGGEPMAALALALVERGGAPGLVTDLAVRTPLDVLVAAEGAAEASTPLALVPTARIHSWLSTAGFAVDVGAEDTSVSPIDAGSAGATVFLGAVGAARRGPGWAGRYVRGWRLAQRSGLSAERPWLSVVVRTQGRRPDHLREALLCLAAQTDTDFEVLLTVHGAEPAGLTAVSTLLAEHDPDTSRRVRVIEVLGGGRSRPLNAGLAASRGTYVAFLDDDDLVTANWVEAFRAGALAKPGAVVRARTALQDIESPRPGDLAPYRVRSGFRTIYPDRFDLSTHLVDNQSPICSLALPREALDTWGIRFDDTLASHEDWDVLLRVATAAGVHSVEDVTSIYHWWRSGGSADIVGSEGWRCSQQAVLGRLAASGLVVHPDLAAGLIAAPRRAALAEQRPVQDGAPEPEPATRRRLARLGRLRRPRRRG